MCWYFITPARPVHRHFAPRVLWAHLGLGSRRSGRPSRNTSDSEVSSPAQGLSTTLDASTATTAVQQQRRCLVISLIRHAECGSNVKKGWNEDDAPDPLTKVGWSQAESLGKEWADTRIDYLMSSPLERAHYTAKVLSNHNESHPEVVTDAMLVERRYGRKVPRLMQYSPTEGREALTGRPSDSPGCVNRSHQPVEGGESLDGVTLRGETIIRSLLRNHGANLSEPPEFFTNERAATTPAVLPDGIPHVVLVSHNIFLSELYEKLHYWRRAHQQTSCDYSNANWSRHILWYDESSDKLDVFDMKFCSDPSGS